MVKVNMKNAIKNAINVGYEKFKGDVLNCGF